MLYKIEDAGWKYNCSNFINYPTVFGHSSIRIVFPPALIIVMHKLAPSYEHVGMNLTNSYAKLKVNQLTVTISLSGKQTWLSYWVTRLLIIGITRVLVIVMISLATDESLIVQIPVPTNGTLQIE